MGHPVYISYISFNLTIRLSLFFFAIGLSTTASSSLSSGELLETPPRAPSSPSAASLQLKPEPLAVEMGGKSNSAPLLENNDAGKTNGKVPVSLFSKIQEVRSKYVFMFKKFPQSILKTSTLRVTDLNYSSQYYVRYNNIPSWLSCFNT